jgi:hypothetical protein
LRSESFVDIPDYPMLRRFRWMAELACQCCAIAAASAPDASCQHVIEEAHQRCRAAGAADHPAL